MQPEHNPQPPEHQGQPHQPGQDPWSGHVPQPETPQPGQQPWASHPETPQPGQQPWTAQPETPQSGQQPWTAQPQTGQQPWTAQPETGQQPWAAQPQAGHDQWGNQPQSAPPGQPWDQTTGQNWGNQPQSAPPGQQAWGTPPQADPATAPGWGTTGQPPPGAPGWPAGQQPWSPQPPARPSRKPVLIIGIVAAVVLLGCGGAAGVNAWAKHSLCSAIKDDAGLNKDKSSPSGSDGPTKADLKELHDAANQLRGYARMLIFEGDLRGAVKGLANDVDDLANLFETKDDLDTSDDESGSSFTQLFAIIGSVNSHARDAQRACGLPADGIFNDD